MRIDLINVLHVLITWQSLLLAIVLITPKYGKVKSNKFLSLLLLTLGVHFAYNLLYTNGYFLDILPSYSCSYGFLYGPFVFLYVKFHLSKYTSFKPLYSLHFVPFMVILIATFLGYSMCKWMAILIPPTMLIYCGLSYRMIHIYTKVIPQLSATNPDDEIKWLKTMVIFMLIIVLFDLIQSQIGFLTLGSLRISMESIVQFSLFLLVNLITYQGLKNPQSFQRISEADVDLSRSSGLKKDITTYDQQIHRELADRLEKYMMEIKPYLDSELNIHILADALEVKEKTISQTINHILGYNFSDYINTYRIEEAKYMLSPDDNTQPSIKEVMYHVGFNSRSVFNTAFKKKTGLTPSEYQNQFR